MALAERLATVEGVQRAFPGPLFHEVVLKLGAPAGDVLRALKAQGILGGFDLTADYPELGDAILVCATETKIQADLDKYAEQLARVMSKRREAPPCAYKS